MGCIPLRKSQYVNAKSTANFVGNGAQYGVFLVSVQIEDNSQSEKWSKEKNEWFDKSRQIILNFMGASVVSSLPPKSPSLMFHFRSPFCKESLKAFQKPFAIEFDYNNYYSGFKGIVQTIKIQEAYLTPEKEETKILFMEKEEISVIVHYVFIGNQLLADLKRLALEGIDREQQTKLLSKATRLAEDWNIQTLNREHGEAIKSFKEL
jgi:hypothetical protein